MRPIQRIVRYQWSISGGMAGHDYDGTPVEHLCPGQTPRFGFWWWNWMPRIHQNGGKARHIQVVDVSVTWLCFWVSLTGFPPPLIPN